MLFDTLCSPTPYPATTTIQAVELRAVVVVAKFLAL